MGEVIKLFGEKAQQTHEPVILNLGFEDRLRISKIKDMLHKLVRAKPNEKVAQYVNMYLEKLAEMNIWTAMDQARLCVINSPRTSNVIQSAVNFMARHLDCVQDPVKKAEYTQYCAAWSHNDQDKERFLHQLNGQLHEIIPNDFRKAYTCLYACLQVIGLDERSEENLIELVLSTPCWNAMLNPDTCRTLGDYQDLDTLAGTILEKSLGTESEDRARELKKAIDLSFIVGSKPDP